LDQNQTTLLPAPEFKTVFDGNITDISKYPSADYRGKQIYFCTQAWLDLFLFNPDPFMADVVEHPLD
jgi:YHS domain-containing protein